MDTSTRQALTQHMGELTMTAVCSVARANELEAENADLRRMVTEERMKVQQGQELYERTLDDLAALRAQLDNAQDELGRLKARKPRAKITRT